MKNTDTEDMILAVNATLESAQNAYYAGNPIMSDVEYDLAEAQLNAMIKANSQFSDLATTLNKVGYSKNSDVRVAHARPMLSIQDYFTAESYISAAAKYGDFVLEEPKRDGISCELYYRNGRLARAVTRGDGEAGEEMTEQVCACKKIPQEIRNMPIPSDLRLRGELVMRNSELARLNAMGGKQYTNTRNLVAGTMKQKDMKMVASREIIFMPWDMYSPNHDELLPDSAFDRMKLAEKMGFPKYEGKKISQNDIKVVLDEMLALIKDADITSDGVVIKADSHKLRNTLGVANKYTRYQHCFKLQNLAAETKVIGIEYGVGRTGKITPVAILNPVNLGGAMVARATLCNETYMNTLGIKIGATVKVLRSGDVIPYITEVINSDGATTVNFPKVCPVCGSTLKIENDNGIAMHFCDNSQCAGKAVEMFSYVADRKTLEIDCLGEAMATELIEHHITNLAALIEFSNVAISKKVSADNFKKMGYHSGVNTLKMVNSLQTIKTATWDRWFAALEIPMVGHTLGKIIVKELGLTANDMQNLPNKLLSLAKSSVVGLGDVKMQSIIDWAKNKQNIDYCIKLAQVGVRPTNLNDNKNSMKYANNVKGKLHGINFVITGSFERGSRPVITEQLEALGAESLASVTSACNLLIVGEKPGGKLQKAQNKGIRIVYSDWLDDVLGK
jgi:DNA ligase (NAD+)